LKLVFPFQSQKVLDCFFMSTAEATQAAAYQAQHISLRMAANKFFTVSADSYML
jgi:hypothetical protein